MENFKDKKLSKKEILGITIGTLLFVAEGINYSLIAPFFPTEAEEKKNISHLEVSLISCCFDVSNFLFTPLLAAIATPEMAKFFFIVGSTSAAVGNICFGVLEFGPDGFWFGFMSLICRLFMGVGAGLVWSTGIPLITSISPKHSGKLTALVESGVGVGLVIGAPIGSLMFGIGGYNAPFASSGAFEVFLIFIAIFSLPAVSTSRPLERSESLDSSPGSSSSSGSSQCGDLGRLNSNRTAIIIDNSKDSQDPTDVELLLRPTEAEKPQKKSERIFKTFLSYKGVWFISQFFVLSFANVGIINVALGPFLVNEFDVSEKTCGFYWIAFALIYTSWAQVVGFLADKGHSAALFFCGSISHTATSLLLALPQFLPMLQNKTYVVTCLCLAGFSSATTFAPGYISLEETAHLRGYTGPQESLKLTVGIWSNFVMCLGKILGSVAFGGVLFEQLGMYKMCLCVGITMTVSATICNLYLASMHISRKPRSSFSDCDSVPI